MIGLYDQGVCIGINDQLAPFQHQQHMKGRGKGGQVIKMGGHVIITRRAFLHCVFLSEDHGNWGPCHHNKKDFSPQCVFK